MILKKIIYKIIHYNILPKYSTLLIPIIGDVTYDFDKIQAVAI